MDTYTRLFLTTCGTAFLYPALLKNSELTTAECFNFLQCNLSHAFM